MKYYLVYSPEDEKWVDELGIDFLCSDNKVHIRLRNYDHPEVISGFVDKLTYLITYLICGKWADMPAASPEKIISNFTKLDEDFQRITEIIRDLLHEEKFAGIHIQKVYRKKPISKDKLLGSFEPGTCPTSDDTTWARSLSNFLETLNISLGEFLFNDAYDIVLTDEAGEKQHRYQKFINKKENKVKSVFKYENLW